MINHHDVYNYDELFIGSFTIPIVFMMINYLVTWEIMIVINQENYKPYIVNKNILKQHYKWSNTYGYNRSCKSTRNASKNELV